MAPPGKLPCAPDDLTSYTGIVTVYRRESRKIFLSIHTDWETDEDVEVDLADANTSGMLLRGHPFSEADWQRIESSPGKLLQSVRVTAWICGNGDIAIILDWQPPQE